MSLPVVRGASAAIYPFDLTISFLTGVSEAQGGYQQRWVRRPGLVRLAIPYPALNQAQKNTVLAAFTSAKGQFDGALSLTLGGVTYTNLSLDSDEFTAKEAETMLYDCPLRLSQVVGQNLAPGAAGHPFPVLANGAIGILPYTQSKRFQTIATKTDGGTKQTYAEYAGGLAGYPADGLKFWQLDESKLSDADLATRVQHFIDNWGRFGEFSFADEDGATYSHVHYAMDDLMIRYSGVNDSSLTIKLEATNN